MKKLPAILLLLNILLAEGTFRDVPADHWASPAIKNVVNLGITKGYSDGTFKGEGLINRYELMVFLNNLSISMEKMMDKKIEQAIVSNPTVLQSRALEEMKSEIEKLKEQLASLSVSNSSFADWQIKGQFRSRYSQSFIDANNPNFPKEFSLQQNSTRIKINALKQFENNFLELDLDTSWQNWENDILNQWDSGVLAGKFLTKKNLTPKINLELFLTTGPGSLLVKDDKPDFRYRDGVGFNLNLGDLQYVNSLEKRNATVERVKQRIGYTLKNFGIFSNSNLHYTLDHYYHTVTTNLQNTRQTVAADIYLTDEFIFSPRVIQQNDLKEKSFYRELQIISKKFIKDSIHLGLMFGEIGEHFLNPNSIFNEEVESINYAEFRVGEYFSNYQNKNLTPSADIKKEFGIKFWGQLTKKIDAQLFYIKGLVNNSTLQDISYDYSLINVGLTYYLDDNFQITLTQDNNILRKKDVRESLIDERVNKFYLTGRF